jgi:hypothetical protein
MKTVLQESVAHASRFSDANVNITAECTNQKVKATYTLTANPGKIKAAQKIIESKSFAEKMKAHITNVSKKSFEIQNAKPPVLSKMKKKCASGYFLDEFIMACQHCLSNCSSCKDYNTCDKCEEEFELISNRNEDQCASIKEGQNASSSFCVVVTFIGVIIIILD